MLPQKIFLIGLISLILGSCSLPSKINTDESNPTKIEVPLDANETERKTALSAKEIQSKIGLLRGRYAIQGLVQNGDTYLENRELTSALKSYLSALRQNKNDPVIINKIAQTYFEMKRYNIAYNYYKNLNPDEIINKETLLLSYIYTLDLSQDNTVTISNTINSFGLPEDDRLFYNTAFNCITNMTTCSESYKEYISTNNSSHKGLGQIKVAFQNYHSSQINSEYLRDTQIVAALFTSKLYPITNLLGEKILIEKPGYLPILKIIAKGYFEIGDYDNAKKFLLLHNDFDNTDPKVNYMLGIVNIKLHEYVLSNIYFLKALKEGFTPYSTISRRLIYNYYLIEDMDKVLSEFKKLIEGKNANSLDYSLGIYYSLINDQKKQAAKWTDKALKKFPKDDIFYGYKGWILKDDNNLSLSETFLKKGYKINAHNPLINLNLGIIEYEKGNMLKAKIYLKNTIGEDPSGAFGEAASIELAKIKAEQEQREKNVQRQLDAQLEKESTHPSINL